MGASLQYWDDGYPVGLPPVNTGELTYWDDGYPAEVIYNPSIEVSMEVSSLIITMLDIIGEFGVDATVLDLHLNMFSATGGALSKRRFPVYDENRTDGTGGTGERTFPIVV